MPPSRRRMEGEGSLVGYRLIINNRPGTVRLPSDCRAALIFPRTVIGGQIYLDDMIIILYYKRGYWYDSSVLKWTWHYIARKLVESSSSPREIAIWSQKAENSNSSCCCLRSGACWVRPQSEECLGQTMATEVCHPRTVWYFNGWANERVMRRLQGLSPYAARDVPRNTCKGCTSYYKE